MEQRTESNPGAAGRGKRSRVEEEDGGEDGGEMDGSRRSLRKRQPPRHLTSDFAYE